MNDQADDDKENAEESTNRRDFLKQGLVLAGGLGLGISAWSRFARHGAPPEIHPVLGPLMSTNDQTTGLPLLNLPEGFRYKSIAWAGKKLADGYPSPMACDGMGVVASKISSNEPWAIFKQNICPALAPPPALEVK